MNVKLPNRYTSLQCSRNSEDFIVEQHTILKLLNSKHFLFCEHVSLEMDGLDWFQTSGLRGSETSNLWASTIFSAIVLKRLEGRSSKDFYA
jgi:hypothetical protein